MKQQAKRNYQKELDKLIQETQAAETAEGYRPPTLFLHSCCAPCSSYVLEYLSHYFQITVFYYNPNISEDEEYRKRVAEQRRLIQAYNEKAGYAQEICKMDSVLQGNHLPMYINVVEGDYEPEVFYQMAKGMEQCPEGGERCFACYGLRLNKTAELAAQGHFDYFATTLTISPLKNADKLNEIGQALSGKYGVAWLPSDFKKKEGYKRSIELSAEYGLYRQNYCGCEFSK